MALPNIYHRGAGRAIPSWHTPHGTPHETTESARYPTAKSDETQQLPLESVPLAHDGDQAMASPRPASSPFLLCHPAQSSIAFQSLCVEDRGCRHNSREGEKHFQTHRLRSQRPHDFLRLLEGPDIPWTRLHVPRSKDHCSSWPTTSCSQVSLLELRRSDVSQSIHHGMARHGTPNPSESSRCFVRVLASSTLAGDRIS